MSDFIALPAQAFDRIALANEAHILALIHKPSDLPCLAWVLDVIYKTMSEIVALFDSSATFNRIKRTVLRSSSERVSSRAMVLR